MCTEVYSSYETALSHQRQSNTYVHVLYFTNEMQDCHFWSEEKLEPLKKKKKAKLVLSEDKHRQSLTWPRQLFESLEVMHICMGEN